MTATHEIRANYDNDTITVYQAYSKEIALPSLQVGRFVPPFSLNRMTWIKPSFLWMMERSNWGLKSGQEYILALRIKRNGWEKALANAVLTGYERRIYSSHQDWQAQFKKAIVYVQWDPERSIRGKSLEYKSIQVGLSRQIIEEYVNDWIVEMQDYTPLVRKLYTLINGGHQEKAQELLPREKVYPVEKTIALRLGINS